MDLLGFWSYVHADDDVDMGRITQLAHDIVGHYEAIKAEQIELFLDSDHLHWGDEWRDRVDDALSNVAFFIPVLTPRYFKSHECRREFQFFANKADTLGITKMILPILYIDVSELHEAEPSDPLMRTVKRIQWEPWIDFRFKDRGSEDYRQAVNALAVMLVQRVAEVERTDVVAAVESNEHDSNEVESGALDKMAALEEAMPRWSQTLDALRAEIERIGEVMNQGAESMNTDEKQGKGFAARLTVARRVASELGGPVERIERLGQDFAADLAHIDAGVRTVLQQGQQAVETGEDGARRNLCEFMDSIRSLSEASHEGLGSVEEMIAASQPLESMSKDMRQPLRRLRNSLTAMLEAREITDSWVGLMEGVDIDCSDFTDLAVNGGGGADDES